MIILGNLLLGIAQVLQSILWVMLILIIARVVISWVNADPHNWIVRVINQSTDPLLIPLSSKLPLQAGGIDFSPIVLMLLISFLQVFLVGTIQDYGCKLKPEGTRPAYCYGV